MVFQGTQFLTNTSDGLLMTVVQWKNFDADEKSYCCESRGDDWLPYLEENNLVFKMVGSVVQHPLKVIFSLKSKLKAVVFKV